MKRGFLFGLGSYLVFEVILGLDNAFRGECGLALNEECYASYAVMIALDASLSVLAIWGANAAPPNTSRQQAVGGWLIGFGLIPVVTVPLLMAAAIATASVP